MSLLPLPGRPVALVVALAGAALLVGCGEDTSDPSGSSTTAIRVVTQTVVAEAPAEPTVADEPEPEPAPAPEPEPEPEPASAGGGDCITVPDVTGGDHQLAQDTMQAEGLYFLDEEDATGQGRSLILDRNWTVVSQSPGAGECVAEDTTILLRSKKDDE